MVIPQNLMIFGWNGNAMNFGKNKTPKKSSGWHDLMASVFLRSFTLVGEVYRRACHSVLRRIHYWPGKLRARFFLVRHNVALSCKFSSTHVIEELKSEI